MRTLTPVEIADEAIGLFLERLDAHGWNLSGATSPAALDVAAARAEAVQETREGCAVTEEDLRL